jgi:fibronectin type 3 domain-containing protein
VDTGISLRWRRGTERDLAGYYVYRSEASTSGYTRLTDRVAGIRFVDETAEPGVTYSYYVAAVDSAGNEGALSEPVPSQR